MADGIEVKLEGVDAVNKALLNIAMVVKKKSARAALRKAGLVISRDAKKNAPVLSAPVKNRKPGTIKQNIVVRPSKTAQQAGNDGVFVGVRPLTGARQKKQGKAGAKNPNDPYYWWWQEFGWVAVGRKKIKGGERRRIAERAARVASGTKHIPGKKFLSNAANKGPEAIKVFMESIIPQIEKFNKAK